MSKRNIDKHTRSSEAKLRILRHIAQHGPITLKSAMGYAAFPNYSFKTPQGAAFSVSGIRNFWLIGTSQLPGFQEPHDG